jgi:phospholipid N-methyltransferase
MPLTTFRFFRQFVGSPRTVGAVAPSSRRLSRGMTDWIEWDQVAAAAELGPGTGSFTRHILSRMRDDARFFMVEINPTFARRLARQFPGVTVYLESVENLVECCRRERLQHLDAIICGLPWASFPDDLQDRCLDAIRDSLAPGGQFATFAYAHALWLPAAKRLRRKLIDRFGEVERSRVHWINLPPAVILRCRKRDTLAAVVPSQSRSLESVS